MVQVPPRGDGIALLYTSIVLLALSWVTFVSRVAVRVWRRALGLDDFAMFIGIVCVQLASAPLGNNDQGPNASAATFHGHSLSMYCVQLLRIWPVGCGPAG